MQFETIFFRDGESFRQLYILVSGYRPEPNEVMVQSVRTYVRMYEVLAGVKKNPLG